MKKLIKVSLVPVMALASISAYSATDLTVYGLLNKEIRHVTQDEDLNKTNYTGVTDVDGFESRLGVKGGKDVNATTVANYKIELGLNSAQDNANTERVRIRLAYVDLVGTFGKLTVGQAWTPGTIKMLKLDPLTATGAQALGYESADLDSNIAGYFGSRTNLFKDMLSYQTKNMSGFTADITTWRSSTTLDEKTASNWTETLLSYSRKSDSLSYDLHALYAVQDKEGTKVGDTNFWNVGAKFTFGKNLLSVSTGSESFGEDTNAAGDDEFTVTNTFVGYKYDLCEKWDIVANYGQSKFNDDAGTGVASGVTEGDQTQMALGGIYSFNANVSTRLIVKQVTRAVADGTLTNGEDSQESQTIISGLTVKF